MNKSVEDGVLKNKITTISRKPNNVNDNVTFSFTNVNYLLHISITLTLFINV